MAEGLNKVMLLGNLAADPELRTTPTGQSVLKLRLGTTDSYVDKNQQRQERTEWHSISVWGKRGEALHRLLVKGSRILVEGRLQTSSYEKDGVKKYRTEIVADDVFFAGGPSAWRPRMPDIPGPRPPDALNGKPMAANDIPF